MFLIRLEDIRVIQGFVRRYRIVFVWEENQSESFSGQDIPIENMHSYDIVVYEKIMVLVLIKYRVSFATDPRPNQKYPSCNNILAFNVRPGANTGINYI